MMHAFTLLKIFKMKKIHIQNEEQQDYQYAHYSQRFLCLQKSNCLILKLYLITSIPTKNVNYFLKNSP